MRDRVKRVVIIGAGFGGLFAAKALADKPVEVILIDRNNFHTFTPLLYQVATCALDPSEIAHPVRTIFRDNKNIIFLLGEVLDIRAEQKEIRVRAEKLTHTIRYDYLIIAAGSETNFFGNDEIKKFAFDLKTLSDSVDLRNHALRLFERAIWVDDPIERTSLLTFVVVGGGPTGIETAGALYELYNHVLDQEYSNEDLHARVILVEMEDSVLNTYPDRLQLKAKKQLKSLGVELKLGTPVSNIGQSQVELGDGSIIPTQTLIWAAGIKGASIANKLGADLGSGNRIRVNSDLRVIGFDDIYCIGDMSYLEDINGRPYPQVSAVAQQQARVAAKNILGQISGGERKEFKYLDLGGMATIGRRRAVAWLFNRVPISGFFAWLTWLVFHLITLIGFRNRLNVLINWIWNYLTYDRSVRIILEKSLPRNGS
ncbi:MAG: FAD-dependent oxidoreductase [Aliifodinibius sp.]|nr:FAD-dependent oxidoreductase [Fodinibius sp.]